MSCAELRFSILNACADSSKKAVKKFSSTRSPRSRSWIGFGKSIYLLRPALILGIHTLQRLPPCWSNPPKMYPGTPCATWQTYLLKSYGELPCTVCLATRTERTPQTPLVMCNDLPALSQHTPYEQTLPVHQCVCSLRVSRTFASWALLLCQKVLIIKWSYVTREACEYTAPSRWRKQCVHGVLLGHGQLVVS